jgi:small conductance mechanosensitive channel
MKKITLLLTAILVFSTGLSAASPSAEEEKTAQAMTVSDPDIAVDTLKLKLKPLPKDKLKTEADAWLKLLEEKVRLLSVTEIEIKDATGEAKEKLLEKATALREERTALVDRVSAAVSAYEAKGGEPGDYKKYISAATGTDMDVTDIKAAWTTVVGWIKSKEGGIRLGKNILFFILAFIAFWIAANILGKVTRRTVSKFQKTSELLKDFFVNTVRRVTIFIGFVFALSMLEVDIGPFLAAIGVAGFVIGFALQGTLSNFASGVMILLYRPYDIADVVTVAGVTGKVHSMSLVSTTIKTFDNQNIVIPNNSIWGGIITNITANPTRRVDMIFGIGYGDDMAKAVSICEEIVKEHPLTLEDPAPAIMVSELGESSVNIIVRPWAATSDNWKVKCDVTRAVKERFDKEGITIPFPQRDIHMYQETSV